MARVLLFFLLCIFCGSLYAQRAEESGLRIEQRLARASGDSTVMQRQGSLSNPPNPGSIHINRNETYRAYTPTQLVEEIFVKSGACVSVSNVQLRSHGWNGSTWTHNDNRGLGYFSRGTSNFEMEEGLLLSTGGLVSAEGPNISSSGVAEPIGAVLYDPDLQSLVSNVYNVSVLTFNFVPISNTIQFRYVFASEEYLEYANTNYNDVFGFFISGPGISGAQNIATLPTTTTGTNVVSINNVNWGNVLYSNHNCAASTHSSAANPRYYINIPGVPSSGWGGFSVNCPGTLTSQAEALRASMEYNGRTVVLTASYTVVPCQTYTLKLAVGNVGHSDQLYQSGVFLEARSFDMGENLINYGNDIEGVDIVYRDCTNNKLVITRPSADPSPLDVFLTYGGTAVNGVDVSIYPGGGALPAMVTIPAGSLSVEIPYQANTPPAGPATFTITISCPCGGGGLFTKEIYIYDKSPDENFQVITSPACSGVDNGAISFITGSGGSGQYESSIDGTASWQSASLGYTGLAAGSYTVYIRDSSSCHLTLHEVIITTTTADAGPDQSLCSNEFTMAAQALAAGESGLWSIISGTASIADPTSPTTGVTLSSASATLMWTITAADCEVSGEVNLTVYPLPSATITASTYMLCFGETATLIADGASGTTSALTYTWYEGAATLGTTTVNEYLTAALTATADYSVIVLNENGCAETSNIISITVNPLPEVSISVALDELCFGEATILTVHVSAESTTSMTYTWYEGTAYLGTTTDLDNEYPTGALTATATYSVTVRNSYGCEASAAITVVCHPLPALVTVPDITECYNTPVLIGASVTNMSAVITWFTDFYITPIVAAGSITVAPATNTVYYVEAISDKGCSTRDSVRVSIKPLPDLITGTAPEICYGESVEIGAEATNISNTITWYSDPFYNNIIAVANTITVSPLATTDFYVVALSTEGCKAADVVTVTVHPLPVLTANNLNICAGDEITVSATTNDAGDFIRWYRDALYIQFIQAVSFNTVPISDTVFYVEAESIYGCISRDSVEITLTLPPQVRAMDDLRICYDEEITLTTTIAEGVISWNVLQTNVRLTASTYYIVTASRPPCPDVRDTVRITVGEELYIEPTTLPPFRGSRLYNQQLTTNAESPHTFTLIDGTLPGGITLQGNGLLRGIPTIGLSEDRDYLFTVQALDPYACFVTKTYIIRGEFYIPSVFSPDGDGINDHFMEGYKVVIFDRLGFKIFEGDDGWDGTCKGKVAPVDTYFYILFYRDAEGKDLQEKGSITLLR